MKLWLWGLVCLVPCLATAMLVWSHGMPWVAAAIALLPFTAIRIIRGKPTTEDGS